MVHLITSIGDSTGIFILPIKLAGSTQDKMQMPHRLQTARPAGEMSHAQDSA